MTRASFSIVDLSTSEPHHIEQAARLLLDAFRDRAAAWPDIDSARREAGSSALQVSAACLSIRREVVPPTINHDDPDPSCGELRVVTTAKNFGPRRVLVHSIGLGGSYYSAAALEAEPEFGNITGMMRVQWSEGHDQRFLPTEEYTRPLSPWSPRQDD